MRWHFKFYFPMLLLIFFSIAGYSQETTTTITSEKKVIITPPPQSVNCTTVAAHWEDNTWIDKQTICTYEKRTEGVAWVQDYWACTQSNAVTGECTLWEYRPGYWVKTTPVS